jgi:integrase
MIDLNGQDRHIESEHPAGRKNTMMANVQNADPNPTKSRDNDGLHKRRGIWHYKLKIAGKWTEVSTKTTNYRDARKIRHDALQAQEDGRLPTDFAKLKFEKASETWLEERKPVVAPKTYRIDRERLVSLKASFTGRRLCDITTDMVRAFQSKRATKVSPRTVNLETKVVRMILRRGRLWARIADEFRPLPENKRGPGRALSPEQERKLFEVASSRPGWTVAYYAALLANNTTARGGELKGLRIGDVDLMERTLCIQRVSTKTDAGARVVPLNDVALWACARLKERAERLGASDPNHYLLPAALFRHTRKTDPVQGAGFDFTKPMQSWRTAWRNLTKAANLPGLRFHDLRHHCITKLAEAGVPDHTLMSIAGHVSREMLEHYSHIRMQAKRDAVAALEGRKTPEPSPKQAKPVKDAPVS